MVVAGTVAGGLFSASQSGVGEFVRGADADGADADALVVLTIEEGIGLLFVAMEESQMYDEAT